MLAASSSLGRKAAFRSSWPKDRPVAAGRRQPSRSDKVDPSENQRSGKPRRLREALLRVPPFPGARAGALARPASSSLASLDDDCVDEIIAALRSLKVGGTYWGPQPELPGEAYALVRVSDPGLRARLLKRLGDRGPVLCWAGERDAPAPLSDGKVAIVSGPCDPWHMLSNASAVVVDAGDELAVLAAIAGIAVSTSEDEEKPPLVDGAGAHRQLVREAVTAFDYFNPYTGEEIEALDAIKLCGFWRGLIDGNRGLSAAFGFAFWKRPTVAPLLWAGSGSVPFRSRPGSIGPGAKAAIWKARTSASLLTDLEGRGVELVEVEDGFIRSAGLGADCVPPLSIVVDRIGVHFDPDRPSELERILEGGSFSDELVERARQLRRTIVASGLSKYESGGPWTGRRATGSRRILVPGQVEDDRAVVAGGRGLSSNFELLRRVREDAPDAHILYKPHPDVEAGHRSGAVGEKQSLGVADEIVRGESISALLDSVDEVQVNTSLAGFEALLREKPVTTHGVPFYAGWGLTRDLGPVPGRRTARRSLEELVAAVLLLYPRYLDPLTGLPCPPEILVRRLSEASSPAPDGLVVRLRRLQGRLKRRLDALRALVVK